MDGKVREDEGEERKRSRGEGEGERWMGIEKGRSGRRRERKKK